MPFHLTVDPQRRLVHTEARGELSAAEIREHQRQLLAHPDFEPAFDQIADLSQVTDFVGDSSELIEIARVEIFEPTARRAIIASRDHLFGLVRTYEILHENRSQVRAFRSLAEAQAWLNTPKSTS